MKHILLIFALTIGFISYAQTNVFDRYLSDIQEEEGVSKIQIAGTLFRLMSKIEVDDQEDQDLIDILKTVTNFTMITLDNNKTKSTVNRRMRNITRQGYETLMTVEEEGSDVTFYIKEKNNKVQELVMIIDEVDEMVVMSISGLIDLNKLSKLSGVGIGRLDELERLEDKP
jgi:hypothetical protein